MRSTEQIYISDHARLKRQGQGESKLATPLKPQFLVLLERKLMADKAKYSIPDDLSSPVRLQMYREAFELFIGGCTHYAPFLSQVKSQYDNYILHLHERIKAMLPMKESIHALNLDCERRIADAKEKENSSIKNLEVERRSDVKKIESLKEERMELQVLVKGLKEQLIKETAALKMESDGRKISQIAVNELSNRVKDMEAVVKNQQTENQEDPITLRIALNVAHKALTAQTRKLVEYEANFNSTVPLSDHEKVVADLDEEKKLSAKLLEDIDGYANRYELLQDHCATLNTYKDLYMVQCGYTLRVLGAKGEPQQKLEYIGLLLTRWRRLIADKPIEELTLLASEETVRFDSGALPLLQRVPKKDKKSLADTPRRTTAPDV